MVELRDTSRRDVLKGIGGALAAATVSGNLPSVSEASTGGEPVALQYFHEDWTTIKDDLDRVADRGYDAIWIQQPAKGAVTKSEQNGRNNPPLGYQPIDFRNFDSELGTEDELRTLIDTAHNNGVEVYLDTVMNHMAAEDYSAFPYFSEPDFHSEGGIPDWAYTFDSSDDRCFNDDGTPKDPDRIECDPWWVENGDLLGLKDLDQDKGYVRDQLKRYLQDMADLGADGYRFDAVKHMPESFLGNYANQWAEDLNMFRVGEIFSGSVEYLNGYVNAGPGMHAFDYPLYFVLTGVFDGGDMSRLQSAGLVAQNPYRAMPFVENHDKDAPSQYELAHAFVLTIEGYPIVYNLYPDEILSNDNITNMVWVKRNLAGGETVWRYTDTDVAVYERESNLLVGLNNGGSSRTVPVETSWTEQELNDYAGTASNVTTGADGTVEISVPAGGWVFYAPPGQGDSPDTGDGSSSDSDITLQIEAPAAAEESVYFTGNTGSLTGWGGGIEGTKTDDGVWEVTIEDPGSFEWKTRRGPEGGSGEIWEGGDNHTHENLSPSFNGWEDGYDGEQPPTADMRYSTDPVAGEPVTFGADGSSDPDGDIRSYEWDFTGDGSTDKTGEEVQYTFDSAGSYDVTLTVSDSSPLTGDDTKTETVQVAESEGVVEQYDADGDGAIDIGELDKALSDHDNGRLGRDKLESVLEAYFGGL